MDDYDGVRTLEGLSILWQEHLAAPFPRERLVGSEQFDELVAWDAAIAGWASTLVGGQEVHVSPSAALEFRAFAGRLRENSSSREVSTLLERLSRMLDLIEGSRDRPLARSVEEA
jgi:hypothetical protein